MSSNATNAGVGDPWAALRSGPFPGKAAIKVT